MRFSEETIILKSFYIFSVAQKPRKQSFQTIILCQKWGKKWSHYDTKEPWLERAVHDIFAAVNPKN